VPADDFARLLLDTNGSMGYVRQRTDALGQPD
jgi:hypothetical protein